MKVLIFEWGGGSYTYHDICDELADRGIKFKTVSYSFRDKNEDEFFINRFGKILNDECFDIIFSVNFFPLVSMCAKEKGIPYVAWCYDNPMDVPFIERTLGNDVNKVYMFDRSQVEGYRKKGFKNVYHQPLAVNAARLSRYKAQNRFKSQVTFVGTFYDSAIDIYRAGMDELCKEYVDTVCKAQRGVYGNYIIDEYMSQDVIDNINASYAASDNEAIRTLKVLPDRMRFVMAADVTRFERILILEMLARRYDVKVFSRTKPQEAPHIELMGTCNYYDEMPQVFKSADINMNITLKCIQTGIPQRALDIMGSGSFLLTNYQSEFDDYFTDGENIAIFRSLEEAIEKAEFYINHEGARDRIARAGIEAVAVKFSYKDAIEHILCAK